jgi:hypothetical protein
MSENTLNSVLGESVQLPQDEGPAEVQQETQTSGQETSQEQQGQGEQHEAGDGERQQAEPKLVPLAALHEERTRRREMAQRIEQMEASQRQRDQILEQRLAQLAQARQQEQQPSFDENPAQHLLQGQQQLHQAINQNAMQMAEFQRQQQAQVAIQQLSQAVVRNEAEFVQKAPDYMQAVEYLAQQRAAELAADGLDDDLAAGRAREELRNLALTRAMQGQNPAEVAYKLAKARGYAPKAQGSTPQEKIQSHQKGVAAARSIGSGGSTQSSGKITAERLASMSDKEFAELTAGDKWEQLFG